jgi:hypothetical protein
MRPQTRGSRVMEEVCSCAEKPGIKSLETAGVVRDVRLARLSGLDWNSGEFFAPNDEAILP